MYVHNVVGWNEKIVAQNGRPNDSTMAEKFSQL